MPLSVRAEGRLNQETNDRYGQKRTIRTIRGAIGDVGERQILRLAQKRHAGSLLLREYFEPFGEAKRCALIDYRWRLLSEEKDKGNSNCGYTQQRKSWSTGKFPGYLRLYHQARMFGTTEYPFYSFDPISFLFFCPVNARWQTLTANLLHAE